MMSEVLKYKIKQFGTFHTYDHQICAMAAHFSSKNVANVKLIAVKPLKSMSSMTYLILSTSSHIPDSELFSASFFLSLGSAGPGVVSFSLEPVGVSKLAGVVSATKQSYSILTRDRLFGLGGRERVA